MLTQAELDLAQKLGQCFNDWCALPGHHPSDRQEFASAIHRLQDMIGMRCAARMHPQQFPNIFGVK